MNKRWIAVLGMLALAGTVRAQDGDAKLPLDKLLETPISTAAKYDQVLSTVAASVSVITDEDIERYGWTSLAEVLQAEQGFYLSYDRHVTSIGMRGSGPMNGNVNLLILINGHPVNDAVFGGAVAGQDIGMDMSMVKKIEIVRGPGSALYGTHAMLAVINIFTKTADDLDGFGASVSEGSHQTRSVAVRGGKALPHGMRVTASGYWRDSQGGTLYYPEFDAPETNDGISRRDDYQDVYRFAAGLENGGLRLDLSTRSSKKGIPGGKYVTDFDADSFGVYAQDLVSATYTRSFGNKRIEGHAYWDRDRYHGEVQHGVTGTDRGFAVNRGGEARLYWDVRPNHRLTGGVEYVRSAKVQYAYTIGDYGIHLYRPYDTRSFYAEYEGHPTPKLGIVAGIRRDDFSATADSTNPRLALLYTPNRSTTLKLLYGSAFRAPSVYEAYVADPTIPFKAHPDLKPETTRTAELVWEQRLSPELLLVGSAFRIRASGLIGGQLDRSDGQWWYDNEGTFQSTGVELGAHFRMTNGLWGHLLGSFQQSDSDGAAAVNAPRYLWKGGLSTNPGAPMHIGLEAVLEAGRRTRDLGRTDGFLLVNGRVSRRLAEHVRVGLTVRNLLNTSYATPVGPELWPQSIRQDGRIVTFDLAYTH